MDKAQFSMEFGVSDSEIEQYIDEGMPCRGDRDELEFDTSKVATWLVAAGKAEIDRDKVASTKTGAAEKLGVTEKTFGLWTQIDGFPGRIGYYPIADIRSWNETRDKKVNQYATTDELRPKDNADLSIKEQRDLLKLEQERGLLVEVEEIKRDVQRAYAYAVAELNTLAGKVESQLPAGIDDEIVRIIREVINRGIRESLTILAEQELMFEDDQPAT